MTNRKLKSTLVGGVLAGMLIAGAASPALAGTGPRTDMGAGNLGLGFDPGAFSVDLGITPSLNIGVDARDSYSGTAWGGIGARATLRLLGAANGWNIGIGGRLSVPTGDYGALTESKVKDVPTTFQNMGAASAYVLLSLPITPWFIMRYPIGMTYYVGPNQNGGQAWTFGGANWSPDDSRTLYFQAGDRSFYVPVLQFLPETAFKFGGFEATLFGSSIAGLRMTF